MTSSGVELKRNDSVLTIGIWKQEKLELEEAASSYPALIVEPGHSLTLLSRAHIHLHPVLPAASFLRKSLLDSSASLVLSNTSAQLRLHLAQKRACQVP